MTPGATNYMGIFLMISLGMKLVGSCLIISGASGYGFWLARRYGEHLEALEYLRQMIYLLKGQILYANAPLEEAFETVGRRTEGFLAELFLQVAGRINRQEGEPFAQMWKDTIGQIDKDALLTPKDRQSLKDLGEHLGFLDREMQERNLLLYLEQLDLEIQNMRGQKQERSRLYTGLGIMGGLFLAVLLC